MRNRSWILIMAASASILAMASTSCTQHPNLASNQAAGTVEPQLDTRHSNVDGNASRERLSARNPIINPPLDLRTLPPTDRGGPQPARGRDSGNGHADRVAKLALRVPGVTHAEAVASGRVVLIGIGVSPTRRAELQAIRHEIRRRLLTQAPEFQYVYVTANPQQVTHIHQIADGLRNGNPLSMYHPRITALMRSMTPVPYA